MNIPVSMFVIKVVVTVIITIHIFDLMFNMEIASLFFILSEIVSLFSRLLYGSHLT